MFVLPKVLFSIETFTISKLFLSLLNLLNFWFDLCPLFNMQKIYLSMLLIVLTYNPGKLLPLWIDAVKRQRRIVRVLLIDSSSTDGSNFSELPPSFDFKRIAAKDFNHGGTRNWALKHVPDETEVVIYMTQDAFLAEFDSLQTILSAFEDKTVGCAYGRQLPHEEATPLAAHARGFNYPATSRIVSMADQPKLGIKTCFLSNSFAAYRLSDLVAVGGFPADVILGEDMTVAARLLVAGKRIAYVANACVYHSHNYTMTQEFRRYFDTGVFHARSPLLLQTFGGVGGEGMRFVRSELNYLWRFAPTWIPAALTRALIKWLGYKLGRYETHLPLPLKRRCSMHKVYWD